MECKGKVYFQFSKFILQEKNKNNSACKINASAPDSKN